MLLASNLAAIRSEKDERKESLVKMWKVSILSGIYSKLWQRFFWCNLIRLGIRTRVVKIPLFSRVFVQFTKFHASQAWCTAKILRSLYARERRGSRNKIESFEGFSPLFFLFLERDSEKAPKEFFNLLRTRTREGKEFHNFLWNIKLIRVGEGKQKIIKKSSEKVNTQNWLNSVRLCCVELCANKQKFSADDHGSLESLKWKHPNRFMGNKIEPQREPFFIRTQIGPK